MKVGSVGRDGTSYADTGLQTGTTYFYVVRAVDEAANISTVSNEASATPEARMVDVTFVVTVPEETPVDATVFIVGNQPEICNWCNPHTVALAEGADGRWRVTLSFREGTQVNYKYTLGSWDRVEKDAKHMTRNKSLKSSGLLQRARSQIGEEAPGIAHQFIDVARQAVGCDVLFHQSPHPLHRVVLVCRILRQPQHPDTRISLKPPLYHLGGMSGCAIKR